ncbi:hypothetical protein D3879_14950 [Pseudomonas cavernicola]|uniref:Uncharacterized protein n=1 Tax=Pseudomonas cavernicola TaxID=2320866 RepID=A0A418XF62_9PSED|nr:hypothetical protein [Pseudomonas cavernicola]RJG10973.1 hypothetical protein D3879_14950 [Pseudomonas cavernicola]
MTKEDIYDEQINPLMGEIIQICKQHNIALIFSAHIPNDEDPDLACTTHLPGDGGEFYPAFAKCMPIIRPSAGAVVHTKVVDSQGSATITAYL